MTDQELGELQSRVTRAVDFRRKRVQLECARKYIKGSITLGDRCIQVGKSVDITLSPEDAGDIRALVNDILGDMLAVTEQEYDDV